MQFETLRFLIENIKMLKSVLNIADKSFIIFENTWNRKLPSYGDYTNMVAHKASNLSKLGENTKC